MYFMRRPRTPPRGRHSTYMVFSISAKEILEEIGHTDLLPKVQQRPKRPGRNVDTTKWCRYHRDAGHNMDECILLNDEIGNLIQRGHLPSNYIKKDGRARGRDERDKSRYDENKR